MEHNLVLIAEMVTVVVLVGFLIWAWKVGPETYSVRLLMGVICALHILLPFYALLVLAWLLLRAIG